MSCRGPGGLTGPESYWSLLERGGDGVGPLPGRWSRELLRRLEAVTGGLTQEGGFIDGVAEFDAGFFGISPREAMEMDPQQRLILEVVWEALERAGLQPERLSESRTGVYLGAMAGDYGTRSLEATTVWTATGTTSSVLAGRVSYVLGLEGPAMTVDTACSSSLSSLHLACTALRQGECDLALAGGVTVMSTPTTLVALGPDNGMAPDGRCKSFSDSANGAGWSEGCGVLVLKRQSDAERDGDEILALIRGSAVNQDGRSQGLTAPNGPSQQRVIRAALSASGVSPDEIDVVEAHGTGTNLGDPIEAGALAAVFGPTRRADRPLWLGSSKSNLGHTQAAAGVLGVMKIVLALRHEVLPKTLHAEHPSRQIEWEGSGLSLLQQARSWPREAAHVRRAGVSSFGISGTNAHVVIEEAPARSNSVSVADTSSPVIPLLVSGRDDAALRAQAGRYGEWLSQHPQADWSSVVATAALHRTQFAARAAVSVRDASEAADALRALAEGRPHAAVSVGEARGEQGKLAFLFTGQGAQQIGMGRALLETCATFRATFEEVCGHFDALLDLPLRSVMFAQAGSAAASKLDETAYAQPALFAVEVALFRQLEQWGITPDILLGHSIGELSAAHVAGVWSLRDACRVVAARGALMQALPAGGAMVALEAGEAEVLPLLNDGVEIAGLNGPRATVISGDEAAVLALAEQFRSKGRRTSRLQVSHAFHSQRMEPMLEAFGQVLSSVSFGTPRLPIVSNVTGRLATRDELCSAAYWVRQVRSPVRFLDGVHVLDTEGVRTSLELGPDGILTGLAAGCLSEGSVMQVVASQRRGRDGGEALLAALGALHVHGVHIDWTKALGDSAKAPVASLPTYAFQRQRYWLEAEKPSPAESKNGVDARFWAAVQSGSMERVEQLLRLPEGGQREHLSALLPALSNWYEQTEADATVDSWCYEDQWQRISTSASSEITDGVCWLVSGQWPDAVHLERLQEVLRAQGTVVECLTVNEAAARLRAEAGSADALLPRAVVYLAGELPSGNSVAEEKPWLRATSEAVMLAQSIGQRKDASATCLWLCTPHALRIKDEDVPAAPYLQALWGLGRTLSLELPNAFGGLADLGPADDAALRRMAATFLLAKTTGEEFALRGQDFWTRKLHHVPSRTGAKTAAKKWNPLGTILITGGTGALGSFLSHWLAERGAQHLILTSRRGEHAPGAADLVAALAGKGCRAEVRACDVGDNAAVDALIRELTSSKAGRPALRHIFHLAGDVVDVPLNELTLEAIEAEQGGKLGGAWALHDSAQRWGSELASFVLYGSAAGLLGNYGQSAYSAANAGLTGLVHLRRSKGLPATIIHWGAWADVGMAVAPNAEAQLRRRGGSFMKPELCLLGLERALDDGRAELAVFDIDWARTSELAGRSSPLLSELPEVQAARAASGGDNANGHAHNLRTELQKLTARERRSRVLSLVRDLVAVVLGINEPQTLASEVGFAELGLDSLMAVEVRNRLAKQTGLSVPATLAFDHPNLKAVSEWVLEALELADSSRKLETATIVRHGEASGALAIIGVGLRFPGGAEDLESFWQVLSTGADTLGPIPAERFDRATYYDPDPEHRGTSYVKEASLLNDVAGFDAGFFGISPREAAQIDPQHRLLLEVTWSALEDAGIVPKSLVESTTGLFIGIGPNEYQTRGFNLEEADAYAATGGGAAFSAGRLAYHLGVQGPVMAVDTACSSSLVALHLASEHLRSGRCDLAIVGGVQVASSPEAFVVLSQTRALASDGRSKTFSDAADGYGRGEGAAVVALMRLEDAQAQGKQIIGVVRGTAVNHDGASSGLTVPNGTAQQKTLRAALADARLDAADIDVVECHGTGTSLGDPIEVQALHAVYGNARPEDLGRLKLGAVKTNVGHLEAAAGLVGVIKMLASFEAEALPPTLHCRPLNPHLEWERLNVEVVDQLTAWPRDVARPRRAGVSAFGLSGTNAHVVIEEAPARVEASAAVGDSASSPMIPLLVSGRDEAALRAQAGRYGEWLSQHPDVDFGSVVATAALHRTQFGSRAAVSVRDAAEAADALRLLAEGRPHAAVSIGEARGEQAGKLAFLFTGQGAQQIGMGRALLENCATFRATFEEVCGYFDALLDLPLRSVMFAEAGSEAASKLDETAYAQPALFAIEVALFRQLEQWGITPDILLGHSIGELSAAHVAGVWSLQDACRVVSARGRLMQALPKGGAMVALEAGEAEVLPLLADGVEIAGLNGPRATVISGDEAAVLALAEQFKSKGRRTSRLQVSHAFHSQRMEPMLEAFGQVLSSVSFGTPRLPIVSNVTGRLATRDELCSADYWVRQVRKAVRFLDGVHVLEAEGVRASLELGPDGILTGLAAGCLSEGSAMQVVASQRRGRDGSEALLAALGALHVHGVYIDWTKALGDSAKAPVASLPTYAFQRQRYWLEAARPGGNVATMGLSDASHPLLGAATPLAESDGFLLTGRLSLSEAGWLGDHKVFGTVLLPGTGLLELGFAAARAVGATSVSQLTLLSPLVLPAEGGVRLQVQVDGLEAGSGGRGLSIYSRAEDAAEGASWTLHAQGVLGEAAEAEDNIDASGLEVWPPVGGEPIDLTGHYARLAGRGYGYGPMFQGLIEAWRVGDAVVGRAVLAEALWPSADEYGLHPALLDSALHVLTLAQVEGLGDGSVLLPFEWSDVSLVATGAQELRIRASVERSGEGEALAALQVTDGNGCAVLRLGGLRLREASDAQIREASRSETQHLYRLEWRPISLNEGGALPLIVGGDGALAKHFGLDHVDSIAAVIARLDEGGAIPAGIVFDHLTEADGCVLAATHATAARGLAELQGILGEARLNETSVAWLTKGAVATGPDEGAGGLSGAPLWGLVRSARAEHPDRRLQLVDVDVPLADTTLLSKLRSTTSEPDLALRRGAVLAPRLVRAGAGTSEPQGLAAGGTVLITGGVGELGSEVARHLVSNHGVRHLLLTSRRGMATPGASELVAELKALGAQTVEVASCDVSDRAALGAVLSAIAPERPLTGVFHLAATLDDGIVPALNVERLERVLRPKLDGAWHLHELTADLDLAAFVLFSSVAALGSPGQANYAAANAFLDALAAERRHRGLAGQSLLWGLWEQRGVGMTAHLGPAELMRMRRQGVHALPLELGLSLLDAAQALPDAAVIPIHLDIGVVQRQFADDVPALYRALLRGSLRRASTLSGDTNALRVRLVALASDAERLQALVELAQEEIAAVLALPGAASVPADQPLKDLGLDSLMAAEIRTRLSKRVGTKLPTTLAFDYPTARAMSRLLLEKLELGRASVRLEQRRAIGASAAASEPIAIVGMSCRTPGGPVSPESYWSLLERGGDGVGPLPGRWSRDLLRRLEVVTGWLTQEGGFVDAVEDFDAGFFGISPREAVEIDPQQRLILEAAWEALERAGLQPEGLRESRTGVYLGSMGSDYGMHRSLEETTMWTTTGKLSSVLAGRVSYVLGLEGPAMTIDTACSSSLSALHLACTALRQGECDLALAGGVHVMCTPIALVSMGAGAVAPDGRSKSFSDGADGAGWSEGCGVLVLKRQSDAERDGDEILALIRGSAVNQDGRSQGLTAPNGPSQQRVIRAALSASGVSPDEIDVVEAHGTGTSLGDPIEAGALAAVFGPTRREDRPLWLGSSKSNLGHTQAAAGVLGVMKMVLALRHEVLPKTLHAEHPSRRIEWEGSGLSLLQQARAWPREAAHVRRAGVSSFGISGTNAHVVIEEAPVRAGSVSVADTSSPVIPLLVSGRDEAALRAQAGRYGEWLSQHQDVDFRSVVATAALHRTQFAARAAVSVRDAAEAAEALGALAAGRPHAAVSVGEARDRGRVVFVFPGQGSQWPSMGRALLAESAVFAQAIAACETALSKYTDWSLTSVLRGDEDLDPSLLERVDVIQPSLFAMNVGLAAVWRSLGLQPSAVVGHSQGEIAAAVVAGILSLEDGARVVALRSQLLRSLSGRGAMAVTELAASVVEERLQVPEWSGLSVAVVNTPGSTVVSGPTEVVERWVGHLGKEGVFCRQVNVDYASHSAEMDPILPELEGLLSDLAPQPGQVAMISTVTGTRCEGASLIGAYWCRNLRQTVRLDLALTELIGSGHGVFVEASAHPVLAMPLSAASGEHGVVVGSLRRDGGGMSELLRNLGALHVHGVGVDWAKAVGESGDSAKHPVASLPTYAFQRQRYWLEAEKPGGNVATMGLSDASHPLLGAATPLAESDGFLLTGRLSLSEAGWLGDHKVFGTVLLPGTGLLELGFAAARAVGATSVSQLTLLSPLVLPAEGGVRLQVQVDGAEAGAGGGRGLNIYSRAEDAAEGASWTLHAQGVLGEAAEDAAQDAEIGLEVWPPVGGEPIDLTGHYARLAARGYGYGPLFQGLVEAWRVGDAVVGRAVLAEALGPSAESYGLHPALLDSALHVLTLAQVEGLEHGSMLLPFEWSEISLAAQGARELRVRASVERSGEGEALARLELADGHGRVVAHVGGLRLKQASEAQIRDAARSEAQHLYRLDWRAVAANDAGHDAAPLIVGGDGKLAAQLGLDHLANVPALVARLDEGGEIPAQIVFDHLPDVGENVLAATHATAERGLAELQAILGDARLNETDVTWLTRGAVATGPDEGASGLTRAPLWGLVRSARAEHPDRRLQLIDVDTVLTDVSLLSKLTSTTTEPELALRHGAVLAPRLMRAGAGAGEPRHLDVSGTVLITGGAGELGSEVARHLVAKHGVRHLLLTSRRGMATPGATELVAGLQELGAQTVEIVSCDVSNRNAVGEVLNGIAPERPLTGVFHLAATLDDGIVPGLTVERLERVLRPKLDGAWHLHELTADLDLAAFVLFSSAGGLGSPGQANYAAANVFLDALAAERRHRGLAAQSLLWGLWEQRGVGMTAHLGRAELMRMRRQGVQALSLELGLELLDAAQALPEAMVIPIHLDLGAMQRQFGEDVPPLYRGLIRTGLRRASAGSGDTNSLRSRLASLASDADRLQALVMLAQAEIAAVLALPGASSVPADQSLKDLGLDSLMAVALRNRLSGQIGAKLPTTLAFDYPTAQAIAQLLQEKIASSERASQRQGAGGKGKTRSKLEGLTSLAALLDSADPEFLRQLDLERRLSGLAEMTALLDKGNSSCIVPIRPGFGDRVLIYIPGLGHGSTRENTPQAIKDLGGDYPIAGLNPYPLAEQGLLNGTVEDLALNYAPHVESWIGDRSVFFVGGSFGGVVAIALAAELERRGHHVTGIALLDSQAPPDLTSVPTSMMQVVDGIGWAHLMRTYGLAEDDSERLAELTGAPSTEALREMISDNVKGQIGYALPEVVAPIYMLHARDHDPGLRSLEDHLVPDLGWSRFGLEMTSIIMVGGTHSSMYAHPDMPGHIDALFEKGIMTAGGEKLRILSPPVTP
ncbi:SDR family NAD(P)-dependent oxidoreductase [Bradyrhizobium ganzhouense]|uniref:SDR family NAD(P)-dependent oxidoreductase n=1 Tax=Bradyrhizobium ganzhouense TaxID=1179767 RepID=UPI003CFA484B